MRLCPSCQASIESDDAAHECALNTRSAPDDPARIVHPRPPRKSDAPGPRKSTPPGLATENGRIDLEALFSLPIERTLYRAVPPPPPSPPHRGAERSSLDAVVDAREPDLEFEDRPTPVTPMMAVTLLDGPSSCKTVPETLAPTATDQTNVPSNEYVDAEPRTKTEEERARTRRRGIAGLSLAMVTLSVGTFAVVTNPRGRPRNDLRSDLAPAAQVLDSLAPIATTLAETPPAAPPELTATPDTGYAPLVTRGMVGGRNALLPLPKASASARAGTKAKPGADTSASAPEAAPPSTPPDSTERPASDVAPIGPFDADAARLALQGPKGAAFGCFASATEGGVARLSVTFLPTGQVTNAVVMGPPFGGTPVGACIASKFQGLAVTPFDGAPVSVSLSLTAPPPVEAPTLAPGPLADHVEPAAP